MRHSVIQLTLFPQRGFAIQLLLDGSFAEDDDGVYIAPTRAEAETTVKSLPPYFRNMSKIRRVAWHDDPATLVIED